MPWDVAGRLVVALSYLGFSYYIHLGATQPRRSKPRDRFWVPIRKSPKVEEFLDESLGKENRLCSWPFGLQRLPSERVAYLPRSEGRVPSWPGAMALEAVQRLLHVRLPVAKSNSTGFGTASTGGKNNYCKVSAIRSLCMFIHPMIHCSTLPQWPQRLAVQSFLASSTPC